MGSLQRFVGPEYYELAIEEQVQRGTSSINVRWEDKAVFDAIQVWLSYQRGASVTHWEVFTFILATALESESGALRAAQLFVKGEAPGS